MADKKKNTNRPASQATRATLKINEKDQPVKSISEMAHDEAKNAQKTTESTESVKSIGEMARDKTKSAQKTAESSATSVKSIGEMARDERKNPKGQAKVESKPSVKSSTATLRSEQKKDRPVIRRETKEPSWLVRFRNSRIGRFVFEAYYELRHKVTWPTFEEARNMTIIVIVLSGIIGLALFAVDSGLYSLFLLISGGK